MKTKSSLPPALAGYKPLYKGRRYWVFENEPERPFEGWTGDMSLFRILLYDRLLETLLAAGTWIEDGSIYGEILWGQGVDFEAPDPRAMVDAVLSIANWYR